MDQSRRQALKTLGIVTTAVAGGSSVDAAASDSPIALDTAVDQPDQFSAQVEYSWADSDISLVIKNISPQAATITGLEPGSITTDSGIFSLSECTSNGPATVAPGREIRIPFIARNDAQACPGHFDRSLQEAIQRNLQINTGKAVSACVTTIFNPRIV